MTTQTGIFFQQVWGQSCVENKFMIHFSPDNLQKTLENLFKQNKNMNTYKQTGYKLTSRMIEFVMLFARPNKHVARTWSPPPYR